jgi:hypothetical protein
MLLVARHGILTHFRLWCGMRPQESMNRRDQYAEMVLQTTASKAEMRLGRAGRRLVWPAVRESQPTARLRGAEKACCVNTTERHHETLIPSPRWACARWAGAGSNELETANAGRQGVWNGTVWEGRLRGVVCRVKRRRKRK